MNITTRINGAVSEYPNVQPQALLELGRLPVGTEVVVEARNPQGTGVTDGLQVLSECHAVAGSFQCVEDGCVSRTEFVVEYSFSCSGSAD